MNTPAPGPAGAPWRALAWALLPPVAVLLLRAALQGAQGQAEASLQALRPATLVDSAAQALWAAARPFVLTLLGLGAAGAALYEGGRAALRRWGWPRVRPWATALWLLLWLALAAGLVASHLNRTGRQPLPEQTVKVLLVRELPPSARGPGGTDVYFELPGHSAPMQLYAEGQPAHAFAPGSQPRLHTEAGRWWGRWATLAPEQPPRPASAPGADNRAP